MSKNMKNERGQSALETAIILIAFVVVASVFAFAILCSGSKSTEKGQSAINAGLEGVQSSMTVK
ncbi:MAG: flagellin, partial [Anaerolineae bacterium]